MALNPVSGHLLEIGDKVRMNIKKIGDGDLDGIEITADGKNYWKYMNEHPDEVFTVTAFCFTNEDETSYELDGYMSGNNWYADELILVPAATSRYEVIKNMTLDEMVNDLLPLLAEICEDGVPSPELFRSFLEGAPSKEEPS